MGLLKDIQEKNQAVDELEGYPDRWDDPDFVEHELAQAQMVWEGFLYQTRLELLENYRQAGIAVHEISKRVAAKPNPGPKPSLQSYKEYKRKFLSKWAKFIAEKARKDGFNQYKLAIELGFGKKDVSQEGVNIGLGKKEFSEEDKKKEQTDAARMFRMMKSGAKGNGGGHYRATTSRFNNQLVNIPRKNGWHRRGKFQLLWPLEHLMSPAKFEEWAKEVNHISYERHVQQTLETMWGLQSRKEFEDWVARGNR